MIKASFLLLRMPAVELCVRRKKAGLEMRTDVMTFACYSLRLGLPLQKLMSIQSTANSRTYAKSNGPCVVIMVTGRKTTLHLD